MDATKLVSLIATAPEPVSPEMARRLIDGAVDVLTEAVALALDVCDVDIEGLGGPNLPELLSAALTKVAERLPDGEEGLVRHRPGSWEAEHVRRLGMVLR